MPEFIVEYWVELFFTGLLAVFGFFIKYTLSHLKEEYLDSIKKNGEEVISLNEKMRENQNIYMEEVSSLEHKIDTLKDSSDANDLALIREILLRMMREGIEAGYITLSDFETASELFVRYSELGGNGKIHSLYEIYKNLPIADEDETVHSFSFWKGYKKKRSVCK